MVEKTGVELKERGGRELRRGKGGEELMVWEN